MKSFFFSILLPLLFLCTVAPLHAQWKRQYPMAKLEDVLDIDVSADGYGFAVGSNDLILRTLAGNNEWELLPGFGEGWRFQSVDYLEGSGGSIAAAGGDGLILTLDKGDHWNEITGAPTGIHTIKLFSPTYMIVASADGVFEWKDDIWTDLKAPDGIGLEGAFILDAQLIWAYTVSTNHLIYYTTNGGMNWTINLDLPNVDMVRFFDAQNGIALDGRDVYQSMDGGQSWTLLAANALKNSATDLAFGATTNILIASTPNAKPNISTDGGLTWEDMTTGLINLRSYSVSAVSDTDFSVGNDLSGVMHSTDGGTTWEETSGPDRNIIQDVYFIDRSVGFAIGQKGLILRSLNGGTDWEDISFGTRSHLSIHGLNIHNLWLGTSQRIFHSVDSGATWAESVVFASGNINDVLAISPDRILAVSSTGYIYLSKNGGMTWDSVYYSGLQMRSVAKIDDQHYMATGFNGVIVRSDDQGESWHPVTIPEAGLQFEQSFFLNGEGWLVTSSFKRSMWHTTDAGDTWDTLALPLDRFWDGVYFITPDTGVVVARSNNEGRAYITFDGGHHWQPGYITSFPLYGAAGIPSPNGAMWIYGFGSDIENLKYCNSIPAISDFMGDPFPCEKDTVRYSVSSQNIDQFSWLFPPGWEILGDANNDTIFVVVGSATGPILVSGSNDCGETGQLGVNATPHLLPVILGAAMDPGAIPCVGSLVNVMAAAFHVDDYQWTVPSDWTIIGNPNQSTIMVQVGSLDGLISVTGSNTCGISPSEQFFVQPYFLPTLAFLSGDLSPCPGDTVTYLFDMDSFDPFSLTFQEGLGDWMLISSQIPNSIRLIAGHEPGILGVSTFNECGSSNPVSLELTPLFVPEIGILANGSLLYPTSQGIAYQWYLNGIPIEGATGDTLNPAIGGTYTVLVTFNNGCSGLSFPVDVVISGIYDPSFIMPLDVYPVPASDELFIKGINGELKFTILDLFGRKILEDRMQSDRIYTGTLSAGLYVLKVESGRHLHLARFIIAGK